MLEADGGTRTIAGWVRAEVPGPGSCAAPTPVPAAAPSIAAAGAPAAAAAAPATGAGAAGGASTGYGARSAYGAAAGAAAASSPAAVVPAPAAAAAVSSLTSAPPDPAKLREVVYQVRTPAIVPRLGCVNSSVCVCCSCWRRTVPARPPHPALLLPLPLLHHQLPQQQPSAATRPLPTVPVWAWEGRRRRPAARRLPPPCRCGAGGVTRPSLHTD
jgi:hypothetical protein